MEPKPIMDEAEYHEALHIMDGLTQDSTESPYNFNEVRFHWGILIEEYENRTHKRMSASRISLLKALEFEMDCRDYTQKDLANFLGCPSSRLSEYLNEHRMISPKYISKIRELGISDTIITNYYIEYFKDT